MKQTFMQSSPQLQLFTQTITSLLMAKCHELLFIHQEASCAYV